MHTTPLEMPDGEPAAPGPAPKSARRTDKGGTEWVTDAYGSWPIINGRPYYGMLVYESDGTCYPLRDCDTGW